jgi:hypothetical protein
MESRTPGSRPTGMGVGVVELWTYADPAHANMDVTGWSVEARDGGIGKVDEATNEVAGSFIVVDTGPWIFGKKVLLPAGVVERLDPDTETVFVNRTKDEIKNAPEYDPDRGLTDAYRNDVGGYYSGL